MYGTIKDAVDSYKTAQQAATVCICSGDAEMSASVRKLGSFKTALLGVAGAMTTGDGAATSFGSAIGAIAVPVTLVVGIILSENRP